MTSPRRSSRRAAALVLVGVLTAAAACGSSGVAVPGPAPAPAEPSPEPTPDYTAMAAEANAAAAKKCARGSSYYSLTQTSVGPRVTHAVKSAYSAGGAIDSPRTAPMVRRYTAGAKGSGTFSAAAILKQAYATFADPETDTYQKPGARTSARPAGVTHVTGTGFPDVGYVGFVGFTSAEVATGTWTRTACGAKKPAARGTWTTFLTDQSDEGHLGCPADDAGPAHLEACRLIWG